jgi:hypothetical protein
MTFSISGLQLLEERLTQQAAKFATQPTGES